jgi:ribosome-associated toxin RatA of RatAB toxin-antitoxin module
MARKHMVKRSIICCAPRELVYRVVADVGRYPEFLSGMQDVTVSDSLVKMTVKKGPVKISWSHKVICYPPERIVFKLVDGPFSVMNGSWTFEEDPGGTKVTYKLEYELLWPIPGASTLIKANALEAMDAFKKRVHQLVAEEAD